MGVTGVRLARCWLAAAVALGALTAGCSAGEGAGTDTTTSEPTSTTAALVACADGSTTDPVVLEDAPATASVVDVIARPSGQLVAVGSSVWVRDPAAGVWRTVGPPPGAPEQAATAAAAADGEVWVATNDALGQGGLSQLHRSTDLATWTTEPVVVDGAPSAAVVSAIAMVDERWVALLELGDELTMAVSPDGHAWESTAAIRSADDAGDRPALFDIGERDGEPVIVGFIPGDLRPVMVTAQLDGTVSHQDIDGATFEGVRLWGIASLPDGRQVLAADQVALDAAGEATGFTPTLYEAPDAAPLRLFTTLPSPVPFAAPADLVVVGDEIVVVGMLGDTRRTLSPAVWSVCLPPR